MPEIMSAEEFFLKIEQEINESHGYDASKIITAINSRDSTIMDRCKKEILAAERKSYDVRLTIDEIMNAIDSAFAEIGGGK